MTAKEYLEQGLTLDRAIERKKEHVQLLRDMTTQISPRLDKTTVCHTRNTAVLQDRIASIVDEEAEIDKDIAKLYALKQEIAFAVDRHEHPLERDVLWYRYVECLSWQKIGEKLHYGRTAVFAAHKAALERFKIPSIADLSGLFRTKVNSSDT